MYTSIENYLGKIHVIAHQLQNGLVDNPKEQKNVGDKLFEVVKELRQLLNGTAPRSEIEAFRKELYHLHNILSEWPVGPGGQQ